LAVEEAVLSIFLVVLWPSFTLRWQWKSRSRRWGNTSRHLL